MKESFNVLILAAGEGTRMKSRTPKVLHPLCGIPMIERVVRTVSKLRPRSIGVVIGHHGKEVSRKLESHSNIELIRQKEQKGSGHAVRISSNWIRKNLRKSSQILVLCGDTPLISDKTLKNLMTTHLQKENDATVLSEIFADPFGYGRIVRDSIGRVVKITEEKDATAEEGKICEVNSGIYCFNSKKLLETLPDLKNDNAKKEYYLTDVIQILSGNSCIVDAMVIPSEARNETMGINSRYDLAQAEKVLQNRIQKFWMEEGVTILNPESTYISEEVKIGRDTTILPGTVLLGKTQIGHYSVIGPHTWIEDSEIGNSVAVRTSYIYGTQVKDFAQIGPFTHLRQGAVIKEGSRIGNFTEVKNSEIGRETKVSHLSYIGDATLGSDINIGAGVITCNFDGKKKHRTTIGSKSFVGSNVNLIAPVHIGAGSILGAGSTITKDVPADSLAIERSQEIIKEGWVKRKKR